MTALIQIQHDCMRVMSITESSVSISLLPGRQGESLQFKFFGRTTWKFTAELNTNFEVHGVLHLLTRNGKKFGD
jgi:hypothetical protein